MTTFQKVIKYLAMAFAAVLSFSIISGLVMAAGVVFGLFTKDAVLDDVVTSAVDTEIRSLDVEVGMASFEIKTGESFEVQSNLKNLKVEERNGTLVVKEENGWFGFNGRAAVLTILVPEDVEFDEVRLKTGAGRFAAESLKAKVADFDFGAGEVAIKNLVTSAQTKIDGGVGKVTILDGELHDLDLSMGMGQLNLTAEIIGDSEFDLGIGESDIVVKGKREDYKVKVSRGIGGVSIDGVGVANDLTESGDGYRMKIQGGIGATNLRFTK